MNLIERHRELVGKQIVAARKFAKLSQEGLAARAGLSRQHVIRIESGRHTPTDRTLQKIADATGVELTFFDVSVESAKVVNGDDTDEEADRAMTLDDFLRIRAREILREEHEAAGAGT